MKRLGCSRIARLLTLTILLSGAYVSRGMNGSLLEANGGETETRSSSHESPSSVPKQPEKPQGSPPLSEPTTYPVGDVRRGEDLYNSSCSVCHGRKATGDIAPRLAGNSILSIDKAFWGVVRLGRHAMPPLNDALTSQQIADIQAWLKTLQ